MFKKVVLSILLCSCASIHNGYYAKNESGESTSKSPLSISSKEIKSLGSKHFVNFDFTIENNTNTFIKITRATLEFPDPRINANVKVPRGRELIAWADAAQQNQQISDYNASLILGSVTVMGLGLMMTGNDSLMVGGAIAAVGASSADAVRTVVRTQQEIEKSVQYPTASQYNDILPYSHLYAGSFDVPPGLHVKKWITLYTPYPTAINAIRTGKLTLEMDDGKKEVLTVRFRKSEDPEYYQTANLK